MSVLNSKTRYSESNNLSRSQSYNRHNRHSTKRRRRTFVHKKKWEISRVSSSNFINKIKERSPESMTFSKDTTPLPGTPINYNSNTTSNLTKLDRKQNSYTSTPQEMLTQYNNSKRKHRLIKGKAVSSTATLSDSTPLPNEINVNKDYRNTIVNNIDLNYETHDEEEKNERPSQHDLMSPIGTQTINNQHFFYYGGNIRPSTNKINNLYRINIPSKKNIHINEVESPSLGQPSLRNVLKGYDNNITPSDTSSYHVLNNFKFPSFNKSNTCRSINSYNVTNTIFEEENFELPHENSVVNASVISPRNHNSTRHSNLTTSLSERFLPVIRENFRNQKKTLNKQLSLQSISQQTISTPIVPIKIVVDNYTNEDTKETELTHNNNDLYNTNINDTDIDSVITSDVGSVTNEYAGIVFSDDNTSNYKQKINNIKRHYNMASNISGHNSNISGNSHSLQNSISLDYDTDKTGTNTNITGGNMSFTTLKLPHQTNNNSNHSGHLLLQPILPTISSTESNDVYVTSLKSPNNKRKKYKKKRRKKSFFTGGKKVFDINNINVDEVSMKKLTKNIKRKKNNKRIKKKKRTFRFGV